MGMVVASDLVRVVVPLLPSTLQVMVQGVVAVTVSYTHLRAHET